MRRLTKISSSVCAGVCVQDGQADASCPRAAAGEDEADGANCCAICMIDERACDTMIQPCEHRLCMQCAFEIAYTSPISNALACPFCRAGVLLLSFAPFS